EIKKNKKKKEKTVDLPDEYKILDIIIQGRRIVVNIQKMMELANVYNEAEVLSSMNKSCSNYHYFSRLEYKLEEFLIDEEENLKIWMVIKKSEYNSKEYSSEVAKERGVLFDYGEEYKKKTLKIKELKGFKSQCSIAKKSLERHIDMIKSINTTIREKKQDPGTTSESF
ncbi:hypothetical protein KAH94_00805, partial [bacterium]|nr:hypothetical protein [bacterium]